MINKNHIYIGCIVFFLPVFTLLAELAVFAILAALAVMAVLAFVD